MTGEMTTRTRRSVLSPQERCYSISEDHEDVHGRALQGRRYASRSARRSAPSAGSDPVEEAVANLKEATELYLEEFPLEGGRRPIITTFEVTEGARA